MTDARKIVAEFVGTFVLVAIGPGAVMVSAKTGAFGHAGVAAAFGMVVFLVIATTGHVSGAHINPAVTVGLWSVRRFPARDVIPYVTAQCTGAICAAFALGWVLGPVGNHGATLPEVPLPHAFAIEAFYSGVLALVIMGAAVDDRNRTVIAPIAIGATVGTGALVTGPLTGGSFNPARSFGPAVVGGVWDAHWLYWLAPVAGMVVAMQLYELVFRARQSDAVTDV